MLVRYFASARAASGVDQEVLEVPAGASVSEVIGLLRERHPGDLSRILDAASFLVDGITVRDRSRPLPDSSELDILPPFAGG